MRVSVDRFDPGFVRDPQRYDVIVNGAPIKHCITADEEAGIAIVVKLDERGKIVVDRSRESLAREMIEGEVKIVVSPAQHALLRG